MWPGLYTVAAFDMPHGTVIECPVCRREEFEVLIIGNTIVLTCSKCYMEIPLEAKADLDGRISVTEVAR